MKNLTLLLLTAYLLVFEFGCADVIYVTPEGQGDREGRSWENACQGISAALEQVEDFDTEIWAAQGEYNESIELKHLAKIYGGFTGNETNREDRNWKENVTIINGAGIQGSVVSASDIGQVDFSESDSFIAELNGFTITGAQRSALYISDSSPIVANCIIEDNTAVEGGGIYCIRSNPIIQYSVIRGNRAEKGAGVYCVESSPRIARSLIVNNTASFGGGIYCQDQSFPSLINSTVAGNMGNGVECWSGSVARILNCIVWNPALQIAGDFAESSQVEYSCIRGGWLGLGNIDANPLFISAEFGDYHLQTDSPCIDAGHPDSIWNDESSPPGLGKPRCDMGAYGGPDVSNLPLLMSQSDVLYVRSDAPPDGDGTTWETALDSINEAIERQEFGEVWVAKGAYRESVQLKSNLAVFGGFAGSESVRGERDWTINETRIVSAAYSISAVTGAPISLIDGFTIMGVNSSYGVNCLGSTTVSHCRIRGYQFGIYSNGGASAPNISNCFIVKNENGVYCGWRSSATFSNCVIAGNRENGVEIEYVNPVPFTNCTIIDNNISGPVLFTNCIVWNAPFHDYSESTIQNCCVEGGWPGENNFGQDPLFADPENGDYHLQDGSPCIGRGLISAAPYEDALGLVRLETDGLADLGALESPPDFKSGSIAEKDWEIEIVQLGLNSDTSLEEIRIHFPELHNDATPLDLIRIPAGEFIMGSPSNEKGRGDNEGPQHRVTITKDFYMGKYEITNAQFHVFLPMHYGFNHYEEYSYNDSLPSLSEENLPANQMPGEFAQAYCDWLTEQIGMILPFAH